MNLTQKFLTKGKEKEIEFLKSYCSHFNISERCVEIASAQDDIHRHVDLWIDNEGWDVKAAKKENRTDSNPNYNIHWIELRNVHGKKGWIFGEASYIAFELQDKWLCVPRKGIVAALVDKIDFTSFTSSRSSLYKVYRREGRKDAIVKVPVSFLLTIDNISLIPKLCTPCT